MSTPTWWLAPCRSSARSSPKAAGVAPRPQSRGASVAATERKASGGPRRCGGRDSLVGPHLGSGHLGCRTAIKEVAGHAQVLDGLDAEGQPILRDATSLVTLRNLLTYTTGYVYDIGNQDMGKWYEVSGAPSRSSLRLDGLKTPLAFDPGTRWDD